MAEETETPTPQISDDVSKLVLDLFDRFFDDLWNHSGSDTSRLNSALLSYFDRIVLLAGGSLTLTFTVVANLSVHLQSIHRDAHRPWLMMACLWLFVCSIISGLLCTYTGIKAQGALSVQAALTRAHSRLKSRILQLKPTFDPKSLEPLKELLVGKKSHYKTVSGILSILTHASLILAFVCMVMFVQANLSLLTTPS